MEIWRRTYNMRHPKGYVNKGFPHYVYKLNTQAARSWFKQARETLKYLGFMESVEDECFYILRTNDDVKYLQACVYEILFGCCKI